MKKFLYLFFAMVLFCAVTYGGCGGNSNMASIASEESQSITDDTPANTNTNTQTDTTGGRENSVEIFGTVTDLSTISANYTAQDGETLTGKLDVYGNPVKISIADGAAVTLRDVTIKGFNYGKCPWAAINCQGDANIILEGINSLKGFDNFNPGVHVPEGKTLTILGKGFLTAIGSKYAAGIGGGWEVNCGNIVLAGGTISAQGGIWAAAIGGGRNSTCGNITIKDTVNSVTVIMNNDEDNDAPYSIGAGSEGSCGTVIIGGEEGALKKSPHTYAKVVHTEPVDLSKLNECYVAMDGEILTGKLAANVKISIAHGANVTLRDVTIEGVDVELYEWAGISCIGDATIILEGSNTVKGFNAKYPGIHVPENYTLTVRGSGSLTASSNGSAAGIGAGYWDIHCGNIIIDGGTITAAGGEYSAGIGGGFCTNCGNITITKNVEKVTATKGYAGSDSDRLNSIGAGVSGRCGTVTIGGKVGAVTTPTCTYP